MERLAKKVLLIGWDGADWKMINHLLDAGQMPSLEKLVNQGVMGKLATLEPPFSPMLWTSIATGKLADKHGILGFTEPTPDRVGVRPVASTSRKVKAIWNILTQQGLKTHVIGWWPSHPAEPINGVCISNHYQRANQPPDKPWPMLPGTVYPPELAPIFAWLRIHPAELTAEHILPFVPEAANIDQDKDKHLESLAKIIADSATVHAAATWVLANEPWDFFGVYYDAIDHFSHGFMNFHPPRMKNIPEEMFELYKDVVAGGYRFHDMMLGRLLQLAGDDATVMLISDHGFHSDHLRPGFIPKEPAGPAYQHRSYGIFCLKGPHVQQDELVFGASLLDITPTLLTLYGLPVGDDMDGKPLVQAFEHEIAVEQIPSWEDVPGACGMHPAEFIENPYDAQAGLQQLVELGYIEAPGENVQKNVERTIREADYNLARVYLGSNRYQEAVPLLEKLSAAAPDEARFALRLATSYKETGQLAEGRRVIQAFREAARRKMPELRERLKELNAKLSEEKKGEEPTPGPSQEGKKPTPGSSQEGKEPTPGPSQEGKKPTPGPSQEGKKPTPGPSQEGKKPTPGLSQEGKEPTPGLSQEGKEPTPGLSQEGKEPTPGPSQEGKEPTPAVLQEEKEKLGQERHEIMRSVQQLRNAMLQCTVLEGDLLLQDDHPKMALRRYQQVEKQMRSQRALMLQIGNAYLQLRYWRKAEQIFTRAARLDPDNAQAHYGLTTAYLRQKKYDLAVEEALTTLGLRYHFPQAHLLLGEALMQRGDAAQAAEAFEVCLKIAPNLGQARNFLIELYEHALRQPQKAAAHKAFFRQRDQLPAAQVREKNEEEPLALPSLQSGEVPLSLPSPQRGKGISRRLQKGAGGEISAPIVIVSGLPRSGTSMMMQMLAAGGLDLFVDNSRPADASNPKGYYEHEAVKRLTRDASWLKEAQGKAVKVVAQLLFALPARYNYKILFMTRDLKEVVRSQHAMLARHGKEQAQTSAALYRSYRRTILKVARWAEQRHNLSILYVNYADVIRDPTQQACKVNEFLQSSLHPTAMAAAVDAALYREQSNKEPLTYAGQPCPGMRTG